MLSVGKRLINVNKGVPLTLFRVWYSWWRWTFLWYWIMMTSLNRNNFRVIGPLCVELTGHRWIPRTKASDAELWFFLHPNKRLSKQPWGWWFETPWRSLWHHCNVLRNTSRNSLIIYPWDSRLLSWHWEDYTIVGTMRVMLHWKIWFNIPRNSLHNCSKSKRNSVRDVAYTIFSRYSLALQAKHTTWIHYSWRRHQMEAFSALLALCEGNSPVAGEFPSQRPVTRSFDVFFDLCLNKRLNEQSWGWWFQTPSCSLRRHCNEQITQPQEHTASQNVCIFHRICCTCMPCKSYNVNAMDVQYEIGSV